MNMCKENDVILRNSRSEQYLCAAKKNFIQRDGILSESRSKTVICHFSDLHADWKRYDNVLAMIRYYKPVFAVHTGDLVCWHSDENTDTFYEKIKSCDVPIYNCIGNHETIFGEKTLSNEYLHDRYIKPLENIHTTGKGYYYTDFDDANLRMIVLNDYENDTCEKFDDRNYEILQNQCDWLIEVLKDCEKTRRGVIVASHECDEPVEPAGNDKGFCQRFEPHPWGYAKPHCHIVADVVNAFKKGTALDRTYTVNSGKKVTVRCAFEKPSEFICYLNGHRHGDYVGYLPSYPDQLSLGTTCSGCFPEGYHNIGEEVSDLPRIPGTVSEDAVNFYVLDRENHTISVIRMGATVNDLFEERIAAKFEY